MLSRREDSLALQSVLLTLARMCGYAVAIVIPLTLVRLFDKTDFGLYKQVFLAIDTIGPFLGLGLTASVFYFVPRDEEGGQAYLVQALALLLLAGGVGALVTLATADRIARVFGDPAMAVLLPIAALIILFQIPSRLATFAPIADRRPVLAGIVFSSGEVARALLIVGCALWFRTVEAVLWAVVVIPTMQVIAYIVYLKYRTTGPVLRWNSRSLIAQLRYSLPFWIAVLAQMGLMKAHQWVVTTEASAEDFALYSAGIFQIPIAYLLAQSVSEVMIVRASAAVKDGDTATLRRVWMNATTGLSAVLLGVWAVLLAFSHDFIYVLFTPEYIEALPVFRIFLLSIPLMIVVDHGILRATGDTGYLLRMEVLGLLTSVLALVVLTPLNLLVGAVSAYVIGLAAARSAGLYKVAQRLDVGMMDLLPKVAILQSLAIAGVVGITTRLAVSWIDPAFLRLGLGSALFGALYFAGIVRLGLVPKGSLRDVLGRLGGRTSAEDDVPAQAL